MRILGFSKKWDKLYKREDELFTTFRYPRRDKDWQVEEVVQVVFKTRSPDREPLGIARIIRIQPKDMGIAFYGFRLPRGTRLVRVDIITPEEAKEDGFTHMGHGDIRALIRFIRDWSRGDIINKLTLYWIERF